MRTRLALLAIVLAALPVAAAATHTVAATAANQWDPSFKAIVVGDSVTFTNAGGVHNWVSDSGMGSCGLPCTRTFTSVGPSKYHCAFHGTLMSGNIRVLPFSSPELLVSIANGTALVSTTQVTFRVDVRNEGDEPSPATTVLVEYQPPGGTRQPITTLAVGALESGAGASFSVTWRDGRHRVGTFPVFATVDGAGAIAEADETNNVASGSATFVVGTLPRQQL